MDAAERMNICKSCGESEQRSVGLWCTNCGCNLNIKTVVGPSLGKHCPLGKW